MDAFADQSGYAPGSGRMCQLLGPKTSPGPGRSHLLLWNQGSLSPDRLSHGSAPVQISHSFLFSTIGKEKKPDGTKARLTSRFFLVPQVLGPELSRGKLPKRTHELSKADLILLPSELVPRMFRVLSTDFKGAETRLDPPPYSLFLVPSTSGYVGPPVAFSRVINGETTQDNAIDAIPIAFLNKFFCKSTRLCIFSRGSWADTISFP